MENLNSMPVWLFRCNYEGNRIDTPQYKDVPFLYKQNCCPITILNNETWDNNCFNILLRGTKDDVSWEEYAKDHPNETKKNIPSYVKRFVDLANLVKQQDILVVLEYKDDGKGTGTKPNKKMGILRKGSSIITIPCNNYNLHYLKLYPDSVITIQKNEYPILNGLIPSNVTLGPIINRADAIMELYHYIKDKTPIKLAIHNFPNEKIEDLCALWLQTKYADENIRLVKVYVKNGLLNFPVLDILGKTKDNNVLAAQVSYTDNKSTVISKIKKLKLLMTELHLMFTKYTDEKFDRDCRTKGDDVKHVSIDKVWTDLYNDNQLRKKVEELFLHSY